jgi:NAD(P)-dependent dehydrogenase (short-subunit alcohol dehydrogenase family)
LSYPLAGKIALVTGATRGIGHAAALALGGAGAQVVAVGRTQGALEALDDSIQARGGPPATLVPLDITNFDGLDQLGLALHQRFGRLDILVHAAAILGGLRPAGNAPPDAWDKMMATNLTASYRIIRAFEPLLRAAGQARAIFLTSSVATTPRPFWGLYAASKAGMEALVRSWTEEIEGVEAVLLDPGGMATRMRSEAYPGEDQSALPKPDDIAPLILALAMGAESGVDRMVRFKEWRTRQTMFR